MGAELVIPRDIPCFSYTLTSSSTASGCWTQIFQQLKHYELSVIVCLVAEILVNLLLSF